MKHHAFSHVVMLACGVGLAGLALTNCTDDSQATQIPTGSGGMGGQSSSDQPALICGQQATLSVCDPITAAPCDLAAGETCDHSEAFGGFKCFPGPNSAGPGEFCDNDTTFCGPSTTCYVTYNVCQHYCCSDAECAGVPCVPGLFFDGVASIGICDQEFLTHCEGGAGGCDTGGSANGGASGHT
jgi:hypothetical protein